MSSSEDDNPNVTLQIVTDKVEKIEQYARDIKMVQIYAAIFIMVLTALLVVLNLAILRRV